MKNEFVVGWVTSNVDNECWLMVLNKQRGWELPGGIIEDNERIEEAILRELFEETGLLGIAKAYDEPYVNYASKVMLGQNKVTDFEFNPKKGGYAIKVPVFSFNKFPNVNKELGPEMKSTGESIYFIDDLMDDYFLKVYSERNLYLSK